MIESAGRRTRALVGLALGLPLALLLGVTLGAESLPLGDVLRQLLSGPPEVANGGLEVIVWVIRVPRVLLLALAGAGLAVSGVALQATFKNPLAEPGLIGVSAGGALGAVLGIQLGIVAELRFALPASAFLGALCAVLLVHGVAQMGGRPTPATLLLVGVAVSALAGALATLVQLWGSPNKLQEALFWMVGGADNHGWEYVGLLAPPAVIGTAFLLLGHRQLDALSLGEEHALSVGVNVPRARLSALLWCALVTGAVTSTCGPIGFVGLIVPHLARLVVGAAALTLLPVALLVGAEFLVLADVVARLLSRSTEVPVGIVTALVGVPFFLSLLVRTRRQAR